MTTKTRSALKAFFLTGLKPSASNFADFIDSDPNFGDVDPGIWTKFTIKYTDILYAGTSYQLPWLSSVPAKTIIDKCFIVIKTYFTGGTISNVQMAPYTDGTTYSGFLTIFSVSLLNSAIPFYSFSNTYKNGRFDTTCNFIFQFISSSANLNALTAGELDFYYKLQQLT